MNMCKAQKYLIEALICAYILLFLFWGVGYWSNALYDTKFDLKSVWDGFTTLSGAGVMAMVKYIMDSLANSEKGKDPYENKGCDTNGK